MSETEAEEPAAAAVRLRNPWWIPPFLGRVPAGVEAGHLRVLGAVALALFFEEYDLAMLTNALKFIAEDLGMAEASLPTYLGVVRLGALPALFLIPLADRFGRRRIFLLSLAGSGIVTFLTAFSRTPAEFVLLQMCCRAFFVAGSAVSVVMISEEFPARSRGWGIGMLAALGVSGHGFAALLFSQIDFLPFGWRFLYAVGIVPVVFLPLFAARLRETRRFEAHRAGLGAEDGGGGVLGALAPAFRLARHHPLRAVGITLTAGVASLGMIAAFQFTSYYVLKVHGWSPGDYALMVLVGGGVGIIGNVVAGHLGDVVGRRRVGFLVLAAFPLFVTLFYRAPGFLVPLAFVGFVFCSSAGRTILRAFSTELFPTSQRGTAAGWFALVDTLGAAGGLLLLGAGAREEGDVERLIPYLTSMVLVGGIALLFFPETGRRELEEISADPPGGGPGA